MPEYNPAIHDPVRINLRAARFAHALTDLNSDSFGNMYKSARKAGFSHSFSRVIGIYYPRWKIKRVLQTTATPWAQSMVKQMQNQPKSDYYPSKRSIKRQQIEENKRSKEVLDEIIRYFGAPQ